MSNKKPIVAGTIQPFRLTMPPIGKYNLNDLDWYVEYFTPSGERVIICKDDAQIESADTAVVDVDTSYLGLGLLCGILYPSIPDNKEASGFKVIPLPFPTGEIIVSKYDKRNYGLSDY